MTLYFDLDSPHNKTLRDWRGPSGAKQHAREHGVAGAWRANDSFVLFYMDAGKLRQKTWKRACPIQLRR